LLNLPIAVLLMLGVVLLWPIMFLIYILSGEDSVFFKHERVGLNNKIISVYKFRTILTKSEGKTPILALSKLLFKFIRSVHLDEFPQCINIIRGDMNVVGPRPYVLEECRVSELNIPDFRYRHSIKPGITGYAQVRYDHNNTGDSSEVKFLLDRYYIEHQSLGLDVLILTKTIIQIIKLKGV
tara:strand:- start:43 stop:588 length:546 start_codon:yes stop_codon:yes gene_type:complete